MEVRKLEVKKILQRSDGVKYVIIPKNSSLYPGEMVLITNNMKLINKFMEVEDGRKGRD